MKKRIVAFVPIKLNSERLPNKNILEIRGSPLCYHIFKTLIDINLVDEVYVYCSNEIIKEYIPEGVKFLKRDSLLDGNMVKGYDIYSSFINEIDADIYILAHTTSPFIKSTTIINSMNKMLNEGYDSAFSAEKIQTFAWYNNSPINYKLDDIPRTQDLEPVYIETSGFYMFEKEIFTKHKRRIGFNPFIQKVDYIEAVDIDTKEDFDYAISLINK
jgi:CMP-N-acetylneuraminic acid synthetase